MARSHADLTEHQQRLQGLKSWASYSAGQTITKPVTGMCSTQEESTCKWDIWFQTIPQSALFLLVILMVLMTIVIKMVIMVIMMMMMMVRKIIILIRSLSVMPSSHLPRTLCDKFVYAMHSVQNFLGIVGGYKATAYMFTLSTGIVQFLLRGLGGQPGVSIRTEDCAEIVRKSCNVSAVAVQSPQPPHGNCTEAVRGSAFARCPCGDCAMRPMTCQWATVLQFFQICKTSR